MYGDERCLGDPLLSQRILLGTGDGTPGGATGIRLFKATTLMNEAGMRRPPIPPGYIGDADVLSRFLWAQSLSDNRIATTSEILQCSRWPTEDLVFNLQEFHDRADAPQLVNTRIEGQPISFARFLTVLAESYRLLIMTRAEYGVVVRIADELEKHLAIAENALGPNTAEDDRQSDRRKALFERQRQVARGYVKGVDQLCSFHPEARAALGSREGKEGAFYILRYMLCVVAVKSIRSLYRTPPTTDNWGLKPWTKTRDELLAFLEYYSTLQIECDAELKARGCDRVFGGGRGEMNMGYVRSQRAEWTAQNESLHRAIALADASGDDFVSCASRYRLCMGIMYGGRSGMHRPGFEGLDEHVDFFVGADGEFKIAFFVGDIATLRHQAVVFEKRLELIGQLHYIQGETGERHLVIDLVTDWESHPQFPNLSLPLLSPPERDGGYVPPASSAPRPSPAAPVGEPGAATHARSSKRHCASCGGRSTANAKLMCCSRCHCVYYCNVECQKRHWKEHKPKCVSKT